MKRWLFAAGLASLATSAWLATAWGNDCLGTPGTLYYGTATPRPKTAEMAPPDCGASVGVGHLLDGDGSYTDADGTPRYACLTVPRELPDCPLPLVVYLHPSLFTPDTMFVTNLPESVDTANLSGDPDCRGFVLLAPQGRDTEHYYPVPDDHGPGWDNWYRPKPPEKNVDVATITHYIEEVQAGIEGVLPAGKIDSKRIYLTGWSNGSAMAIYYGQTHPDTIAAIGVYSSPNPYGEFEDPCPVVPNFAASPPPRIKNVPRTPLLHVHNDCDIAGICPSGEALAESLVASGEFVSDQIINAALEPAGECVDVCNRNDFYDGTNAGVGADVTLGSLNHGRWPHTWTPMLLHFFRLHPKN